jgi:glycosyltransferase involved in cell wall biosynthesis
VATLLVDGVVTSSKEGFRIPSSKMRIIGQGIEITRFVPEDGEDSPDRPFTILSLGRLSPVKRVDLLIEAVAVLRRKKPEFPLHVKIVGGPVTDRDQDYLAELTQQVKQHQLQDIIAFEGRVPFPKVVPYYQQSDCFVDMSETGSLDKTVLEAMSCGVAVIVNPTFTKVIGTPLAETWVIEREVDLLCDRILHLVSMPRAEQRKLGEQLRAIVVRDHGLTQLCEKIVHELEGVKRESVISNQ